MRMEVEPRCGKVRAFDRQSATDSSDWAVSVSPRTTQVNRYILTPNAILSRWNISSSRMAATLRSTTRKQRLDEFSTAGALAPGFVRYQVSPGPHRFTLRTLSARPVRLFGWVADRTTGVTYEALGINGAGGFRDDALGRKHAGHVLANVVIQE